MNTGFTTIGVNIDGAPVLDVLVIDGDPPSEFGLLSALLYCSSPDGVVSCLGCSGFESELSGTVYLQ